VSNEELRQSDEEKDATILKPRRTAEAARTALDTEKKQVEGKWLFSLFACWPNPSGSAPNLIRVFAFRPADSSRDIDDPS
jgi:hypothetical protein